MQQIVEHNEKIDESTNETIESPTEPTAIDKLRIAGFDTPDSLLNSLTQDSLIGQGGNAKVYTIPGIDDYVVRVVDRTWTNLRREQLPSQFSLAIDPLPEINVGQKIAEAGIVSILKKQTGIPAGVPQGELRKQKGEQADSIYLEHNLRTARMTQTAFDELAKTYQVLNQKGFRVDPSKANNILVDENNQRFGIVDVNFEVKEHGSVNDIGDIVVPLFDNSFSWNITNKSMEPMLVAARKEILLKSLIAGQKAGLTMNLNSGSLEFSFKLADLEGEMTKYAEMLAKGEKIVILD